jgi:pimeloyl-ACP methyl ester carboxylesterase
MHAARRLVIALTLAGTIASTASACTVASSGNGSALLADGRPVLAFRDCSNLFDLSVLTFPRGRERELSIGCARVAVPADYDNPSGPMLSIDLVRVHDRANGTGRALLVNPGGPGASGIELGVDLSARVSDAVLNNYDLIGFDPRGVGLSSPVSCISDTHKDELNAASPDVLTPAGFSAAKQDNAAVADACSRKYGAELADFSTVATARDLDRIRQALGTDTLNYLGFSYGTELGAQYAHLFPSHVGRFVLDGAVDPYSDVITRFASQLKGFEQAFDQFAANCRTVAPCRTLTDPRQAVYDLVATSTAHPIPAKGDRRAVTSSLLLTGVLSALYSRDRWPTLGAALIAAQHGNGKQLLDLADQYNERDADGHYTNVEDANTAIGCNDSPVGPSDDTVRATALAWQTEYPMFGSWSAPALFSCQEWQPIRTPVPVPTAAGASTILVVGNLHDPATPYQGALDLTKALGSAVLLSWDGAGHTSYLQGSGCVDAAVDAYLTAGTLPASGTVC